ncbi:MAG: histidinol-phosphate transaminase [Myxococcales bacterium]|nr:histidinol-phosphate transaminase [Myxococcales bacterium]
MMDLKPFVPERIEALSAYETEDRGRYEILLDANELPYETPASVRAAVADEIAKVALHRYPDCRMEELRNKVTEDLVIAPDQILFGNGSDDLLQMIALAFSRPREGRDRARFFHFEPSFSMYRILANIAGAESVGVPLGEDCDIDLGAFEAAATEGAPNVIFVGFPNNPTGRLFDRGVIESLLETSGAIVVVDEAYHDYCDETFIGELDRFDNLIVLRTFSKVGAAAIRLGVAAAQPDLLDEMNKIRLPFNVNTLTQRVAMTIIDHRGEFDQSIARVVNDRGRVERALGAIGGLQVVPSAANFVFFRAPGRARALFEGLKERGILIRCLAGEGLLADALRVTIGTEAENAAFLKATQEILAG